MKKLFLYISILFPLILHAEIAKQVSIESSVHERVSALVHQFDSDAQVYVKVKMRDVKLELPGTSLDYFGPTGIAKVNAEDVESLDIRIVSTLDLFPAWAKAQIEKSFSFGNSKTNVKIEKYEPEVLDQIYSQQPFRRTTRWIGENLNGAIKYGFGALALIIAGLMTLFAGFIFFAPGYIRNQITRLVGSLDSLAESEKVANERNEPEIQTMSENDLEAAADSLAMPSESLTELMADCYWTKNDKYAKWVWEHLAPTQRQSLLQSWVPMTDYAQYLQTCKSSAGSYHSHPYYLKPFQLKNLNADELQKIILKNNAMWMALSPLRQASINVSLNEKLKMVSAKLKDVSQIQIPNITSPLREFETTGEFGEVSLEDETAIWNDPNIVPDKFKSQVNTLVWLAKVPDEQRKELLSQFTAIDLAKAWLGPQEALDLIKTSIPDKKWNLVESYLKNTQASRKSESFRRLSRESAKILVQAAGESDEVSKAS